MNARIVGTSDFHLVNIYTPERETARRGNKSRYLRSAPVESWSPLVQAFSQDFRWSMNCLGCGNIPPLFYRKFNGERKCQLHVVCRASDAGYF
jgi:hypothetical protein